MKHLMFLDIDGVLANNETYGKNVATEWGVIYPFDETNVKLLNKLLSTYEIEYIISSDWRKYYTLDELCGIFRWNGITQMPIGTTPILQPVKFSEDLSTTRIREIEQTMKSQEVTGVWFALDDMNLKWLNNKETHEVHFVLSDGIDGLKGEGVYENIITLLNTKNLNE